MIAIAVRVSLVNVTEINKQAKNVMTTRLA